MIFRFRKQRRFGVHARRYAEIAGVLLTYGFTELVQASGIVKHFGIVKRIIPSRDDRKLSSYTLWEKIRMALDDLGPSFIKLGQMASNRRDMLPAGLVDELEKLQDRVAPFPAEQAIRIIEEDLEGPLESIFTDFELTPIASASIAQVHRARLKTGEIVAIKVRRPKIIDRVEGDLQIMYRLARVLERHVAFPAFRPQELVEEFDMLIHREMDLHRELLNIKKFAGNFRSDSRIFIPAVYPDYSSSRLLTMEYVDGIKLSQIMNEVVAGVDRKEIAARGAELVLKQIFIDGFFHADPHPGNILVLPGNVICFLDFGMMGNVNPRQQDELNDIMLGMVQRDSRLVTRAVMHYTRPGERVDSRALEAAIFENMQLYMDLPLEDIDFTSALQDLIDLVVQFNISVPANLALMAKALITIEGVGQRLDPEFRTIEQVEKFSHRLLSHKFHPRRMANELYLTAMDYSSLMRNLPDEITGLLRVIRNHELRIELEHTGIEPLRDTMDKIGFRLVFGLVLSALLISSSLMVHAGIEPKWNGIPIIGLIGFVLGGGMGVIFLMTGFVHIMRNRFRRPGRPHR